MIQPVLVPEEQIDDLCEQPAEQVRRPRSTFCRKTIRCSGETDIGRKRQQNEDRYFVKCFGEGLAILAVADGMGGHVQGAKASELAIDTLEGLLGENAGWLGGAKSDLVQELLSETLLVADQRIKDFSRQSVFGSRMGTTFSAAVVSGPRLIGAHAGDSRCYLIRKGEIEQLTTDHTFAQAMRGTGMKNPPKHLRHMLFNSIGGGPEAPQVDVFDRRLEPGDVIVLCSDGLYEYVADEEIAALVEIIESPQDACRELIDLANHRGGSDNVSVIVAKI